MRKHRKFLLVTKSEIGAERLPLWEASEKCSASPNATHYSYAGAFIDQGILNTILLVCSLR